MGWFTDVFGPRWRHRDPHQRKLAVRKLADQDLLAQIAREDGNAWVRAAAVVRLTDQAVIAGIAEHDPDRMVRLDAAHRVTEASLLIRIAQQGRFGDARLAAVARLADPSVSQALYAGIVLTAEDSESRAMALDLLDSQPELARVALEMAGTVPRPVVAKLMDQERLAEIALGDRDPEARRIAAGKLEDQELLARVALSDRHTTVCWAAIERIDSAATLAEIAANTQDAGVGGKAVERVGDNTLLAMIVGASPLPQVRAAALGRLGDQALLEALATGHADPGVRLGAALKLQDLPLAQRVITELIRSGQAALADTPCEDESLLWELATQASERKLQLQAVVRLTRLGWSLGQISAVGCPDCGGSGYRLANLDSPSERDVRSHPCGCNDDRPYVMTAALGDGSREVSLTLASDDLRRLRQEGVRI